MRIGFIGAGKVGFSLGKYLVNNGKCIVGYYSYNIHSAKEAAQFTDSAYFDNVQSLIEVCDTLFLTVPDNVIGDVYSQLYDMDIAGKKLIHCSGVLTTEVFNNIYNKNAKGYSLHPLCAISDKYTGYKSLSNTYFTVEGQHSDDIVELILSCGNNIQVISGNDKIKYHAAAVCASNLVVGLYDMATRLLGECGLNEEFAKHALEQLFIGNAKNVVDSGTVGALTGPVERADDGTVYKHLSQLNDNDREIYRLLSKELIDIAREKNPERSYDALENILK